MSASDVAAFLRERAKASNMTYTDISRHANISRQTWYKLINAQVAEAKLSTVARVCDVLKIDPRDVMRIYFDQETLALPETEAESPTTDKTSSTQATTTPTAAPSTPLASSSMPHRAHHMTRTQPNEHIHP